MIEKFAILKHINEASNYSTENSNFLNLPRPEQGLCIVTNFFSSQAVKLFMNKASTSKFIEKSHQKALKNEINRLHTRLNKKNFQLKTHLRLYV